MPTTSACQSAVSTKCYPPQQLLCSLAILKVICIYSAATWIWWHISKRPEAWSTSKIREYTYGQRHDQCVWSDNPRRIDPWIKGDVLTTFKSLSFEKGFFRKLLAPPSADFTMLSRTVSTLSITAKILGSTVFKAFNTSCPLNPGKWISIKTISGEIKLKKI